MKQIEAGCMAIVINSHAGNNGICVTVGNFIGCLRDWPEYNDMWEVDKLLKAVDFNTGMPEEPEAVCSESHLMRIDGGEFIEEEELAEAKL